MIKLELSRVQGLAVKGGNGVQRRLRAQKLGAHRGFAARPVASIPDQRVPGKYVKQLPFAF